MQQYNDDLSPEEITEIEDTWFNKLQGIRNKNVTATPETLLLFVTEVLEMYMLPRHKIHLAKPEFKRIRTKQKREIERDLKYDPLAALNNHFRSVATEFLEYITSIEVEEERRLQEQHNAEVDAAVAELIG
jgi:hypothetical protein